MLIGYARVSKANGSQSLDLQRDALQAAGVDAVHVYHDFASGVRDDRPGLDSCVRVLRTADVEDSLEGLPLAIVEPENPPVDQGVLSGVDPCVEQKLRDVLV